MEILQLLSSHPVVVSVIAGGVVALVILCCCCCLCCGHHNHRSSATRKPIKVITSDLESGSLHDHLELTKQSPNLRTKGGYTLLGTDEPEDCPDFPAPPISAGQEIERPVIQLPYGELYDFVNRKIIPDFNEQRKSGNQFAVVVLLSENDFDNICQTSFIPSDSGKPILDKCFPAMPHDRAKYGNYIVARPFSNNYHSEEVIFALNSVIMTDNPFSHLWRAYVEHNGVSPNCILIYSWYLPCSRCTDAIIRSLGEEPYNSVSVILAHTRFWYGECTSDQNKSREKLASKKINVHQVGCPIWIPPA